MPSRPIVRPLALMLAGSAILPSLAIFAQEPVPAPAPGPVKQESAKEVVKEVQEKDAAKPAEKKEAGDPIARIKEEGLSRSQVMTTLSHLTDVIGPRLTSSPGLKRANEWTRDTMAGWSLENAHLEPWGPFGRGWTLKTFSMQVVEPQCIPLIAYPKAWSPGVEGGSITAPLVYLDAKAEADLEKYKGKLKGAIVMLAAPREVPAHFEPLGTRLTDTELLTLADADQPNTQRRPRQAAPAAPAAPGAPATKAAPPAPGGRFQMTPEQLAQFALNRKKTAFVMEEGAAAIVDCSSNGDGGTLFVAQAALPNAPMPGMGGGGGARRPSVYDVDAPKFLPQVTMAKEHYNRLVRMAQQGESLKVALDLAVEYQDADLMCYNTVAEIPGADLKDEVVMLGGHLDSWHSGTGATDNAAGCSVGMEAMRILKALDLKPRRTVRIALWSGEEQGLLGSRAYVKEHFGYLGDGSPAAGMAAMMGMGGANLPITKKPEYDRFSVYFNLDNGTGKVRGIYLQGNEAARTVFRPWLAPFKEMGATTVTVSNTGGTDHQSFDAIGLPGFQFIQDTIEYDSRTHHSNQDLYDRIQADDMKQASVIMAAFVYNAAMRDEKIPRKPTPAPAPTATPATPPATTTTSTS